MSEAANAAQAMHWNEVAGPKWVSLGQVMETRLCKINNLLLAHAGAVSGEAVLEIGCGTGATTLLLAEAVGARGSVVGIDISAPMLAVARKRVAEQARANISLLLADAQTHSLHPHRFDLIVSRFGVMFFADPMTAFRNLLGALRHRGRLCFVCWAPLAENPHWQIPFDLVVNRLGSPAPKPAHAPGPLAFSDVDYVQCILDGAGFEQVRIARETVDIIGSTPEKEAELACLMGPSGALLDEHKADEGTRHAVRRQIAEAFVPQVRDGQMLMSASVFVATAGRLE